MVENKETTFAESAVISATTQYFNGDTLAGSVWPNKYSLKNKNGQHLELTPTAMHWRIANEVARIEANYENPMSARDVFDLIDRFKYIVPQGSPMMGIGNTHQVVSLSNCFVIGNPGSADSYGAIMKTDQEQIQLMKRRGGVGHDLSATRPRGAHVKNAAITSTGVVPFMERFSNSTREVAQDGRRGALMLSLAVRHPEAEQFVEAKVDQTKVTGANISLRIDDAFMVAGVLQASRDYQALAKRLDRGRSHAELEAAGDLAALDQLLAEEYSFTNSAGVVVNKAQDVAGRGMTRRVIQSVEVSEESARTISTESAVVTGKVRSVGVNGGIPFDIVTRYTTTWGHYD
jgi:ribonucleotide reductase alpha subunit